MIKTKKIFYNKKHKINDKYQKGWTLIELTFVMLILVILAIFAWRSLDLRPEARFAKMQGLQGALLSAMQNSHATQLTTLNADEQEDITLDGKQITMVNGYPSVYSIIVASGMSATASFDSTTNDYTFTKGNTYGDYHIVNITTTIPRTITFADSSATATGYGKLKTSCIVTYTEADDPETGIYASVKILGYNGATPFPKNDIDMPTSDKNKYGNNVDVKRSCGID